MNEATFTVAGEQTVVGPLSLYTLKRVWSSIVGFGQTSLMFEQASLAVHILITAKCDQSSANMSDDQIAVEIQRVERLATPNDFSSLFGAVTTLFQISGLQKSEGSSSGEAQATTQDQTSTQSSPSSSQTESKEEAGAA